MVNNNVFMDLYVFGVDEIKCLRRCVGDKLKRLLSIFRE